MNRKEEIIKFINSYHNDWYQYDNFDFKDKFTEYIQLKIIEYIAQQNYWDDINLMN